jgi:hypothetical protein
MTDTTCSGAGVLYVNGFVPHDIKAAVCAGPAGLADTGRWGARQAEEVSIHLLAVSSAMP